jgi:hypothetical protein
MKCLQKKYDKLEEECKSAVRNFTKTTMIDPTLDFLLMKACEPMIDLFCSVNEEKLFSIIMKFLFFHIECSRWKRK